VSYPYYPQQMPDPAAIRSKDESDLNTLGILHYVWTGLLGCTSIGVVAYFLLFAAVFASAPPSGPHGAHDQEVAAGIMGIMGVIMGILMIPMFVAHLLAAAGLRNRTRYVLVLVMSGMACLSVPLGTGLGIWTILVLQRPSVKALFGRV
jgi:hypothetical protein